MNDAVEALLLGTSFFKALEPDHAIQVRRSLVVQTLGPGDAICKRGFIADRWVGVAGGMINIENSGLDGRLTTLINFSSGCWFGEGTLLKHETWPFSAVAGEESVVATIPAATFHWLLAHSLPFAHFLIAQLNTRMGQFVERCQHARLHEPQRHVAHCLAELMDPRFHPRTEDQIHISQEDLARLAGVSRALVNRALRELEAAGLVKNQYRSILVFDTDRLRAYSQV